MDAPPDRWSGRLVSLLAIAAAIGCALPPAVAAQVFGLGPHEIGVRVAVGLNPYEVTGATAPQILRQLETAGPRSVVRYLTLFTWSYDAEVLPRMDGSPSDQCRFTDFEIVLDFTATYPRWSRPPDADPKLVEAWAAFGDQIERQWVRNRDEYVARARELVQRSRRHEDHCPLLTQRFHTTVREVIDPSRPLDGHETPEPLGLRWPPAAYDHLLDGPTPSSGASHPIEVAHATAEGNPAAAAITDDAPASDSPGSAIPAVSVRPGRPRPAASVVPDLAFATDTDLKGSPPAGFVAGLHHQGELQFFDAFGVHPGTGEPLSIDSPVPIPAFTQVLLSTLAIALDSARFLDLDLPVSVWLDDVSPRLGSVTLRQLLEHRAGLDNAPPRDSTMAWGDVLDRLDDRALFTDPGVLPSYSMYSFGLAARVVERATDTTLEDALQRTILRPLGMRSTTFGPRDVEGVVDGLPVTHTSAADLLRFWYAWLDGTIGGVQVELLPGASTRTLAPDGREFRGGLWIDRPGGLPRLSLVCGDEHWTALVQVYPRTGTIVLTVGAGRWPRQTGTYLLDAVGRALRIGNEVFGPVRLAGVAGFGRRERPCGGISTSEVHTPVDFGPRAGSDDWAGRYVNGDWFFALQDEDGFLVSPRAEPAPWRIHHFEGDTYFASVPPEEGTGVGFPFRLFRGPDGRRYLMLGDRAYLHEDDRPPR